MASRNITFIREDHMKSCIRIRKLKTIRFKDVCLLLKKCVIVSPFLRFFPYYYISFELLYILQCIAKLKKKSNNENIVLAFEAN